MTNLENSKLRNKPNLSCVIERDKSLSSTNAEDDRHNIETNLSVLTQNSIPKNTTDLSQYESQGRSSANRRKGNSRRKVSVSDIFVQSGIPIQNRRKTEIVKTGTGN